METTKPLSHVKAGLIIAGALVIYSFIIQIMGLTQNSAVGLLQYAIIIGGIIFFVKKYGKDNDYILSFGNLFAYGFKATTVFTVINILFLIVFFAVFPDLREKTFEIAREQMQQNPSLSEEQVEKAIDVARRFFWVGLVGGTMFLLVLIGAIGSLIGAALTKKRPHNPFDQQSV